MTFKRYFYHKYFILRFILHQKKYLYFIKLTFFVVMNGDRLALRAVSGCSSDNGAALNFTSLLRVKEPLV